MAIYLDNLAATPIDPRVAEHHATLMRDLPGNAHSGEHAHGAQAAGVLDDAADAVSALVGRQPTDVVFTPGASAALFVAVRDVIAQGHGRRPKVLASAAEHPALLAHLRRAEQAGEIDLVELAVDETAAPRLNRLESELRAGADLVCAMAANNEVGTITRIDEIATLAHRADAKVLVDASQAAGRISLDVGQADYVVLSGAKMYGPRRVGALVGALSSAGRELADTLFGSPDAAAAGAMALACRLRGAEMVSDENRVAAMRDRLQATLEASVEGILVNGNPDRRLGGSLHVSAPTMPGEAVVARLWGRVSLSTGAACQSGVPGPSHVLMAMGVPAWVTEGAVRIGIGIFNTDAEIDEAAALICEAMSPAVLRKYA